MRKRPCILSASQEGIIAKAAERLPEARREEFVARVKSHLAGAPENTAVKAAVVAAMEWEGGNYLDKTLAGNPKPREPRHLIR